MRALTRTFLSITAGFILTAAIAEITVYSINRESRGKAESLLRKVEALQIGKTTLEDCRPILTEYTEVPTNVSGGGRSEEVLYSVAVVNRSLNNTVSAHPHLWILGLKPSAVTVDLSFQEKRLTHISYRVDTVSALTPFGTRAEIVAVIQVQSEEIHGLDPNYYVGYGIRPSSLAPLTKEYGLGSIITPSATNDAHNAAFDFDLSCMSSLRGCRAPCELLPSVWKEVKRRSGNNQFSLSQEVLEDSKCFNH
jgi:hypothetical protein